jgi:hypothetical protein
MKPSRGKDALSTNARIPAIATPTTPMPTQNAYAMPTGRLRSATASMTKLTSGKVMPMTLGQSRVKPFARPGDFDGLDLVLRSLAAVPRAYSVVATLFATPEEARQALPASLGAAALSEEAEGVVLRCTTDSPAWMARVLAGLECDFVVHEPPELRDALRRLAARLVRAAADPSID